MSPLDAARRLAADDGFTYGDGFKSMGTEPWCHYGCGDSDGYRPDETHAADCPFLALPAIVRALEAAQTLSEQQAPTYDPETGITSLACWFCGRGDLSDIPHEADCPWQALVAALKGEETKT